MKCIVVDDEPLALNIIKDFCSKVDFLDLIATCCSPVEAVKVMNSESVALMFLDIQMPHISGLEFIKTLSNPPLVIFTTAYSEHALEGFEVDAVDYLVKPIPFDRFFKAVNKAYEYYCLKSKSTNNTVVSFHTQHVVDYILVKVEYSTVKVNLCDIQYIEGVKDYVKIIVNGKSLLTKSTMKNIEGKLPSDEFVRVHKSYIVALSRIEKLENNRIIFKDQYIPIGLNYRKEFYDLLSKYRL